MPSQRERVNQKRRTRDALVDAAQRLFDQGRTPSVPDVADEALVSRATAYRYFPSQEHLLLEVVLERPLDELERSVTAATASDEPSARVEGLVSAVHGEVAANERAFRSLLSLSIAQASPDEPTVASIRGERRRHWIEQALESFADGLDDWTHRRLVNALALCVGAEAFVVLHDLCGLDRDERDETLRWAASALLASAAAGTGRSGR